MAHSDRNNSKTTSANIADTDLNALSKEQLIAMLQEQDLKHKQALNELQRQSVKEQKSQTDIITNLRDHIKNQDTQINSLHGTIDNYKKLTYEQEIEIKELKAGKEGQKVIIDNALYYIRDNQDAFEEIMKDNSPEDLYNLKEVNSYLMLFLSNARTAAVQLGRYLRGTYVSSQS